MAKLPTFESQRRLTTQQPQVLRSGAEKEGAGYEAIAQGLGAAQGALVKWSNALNTIQTTTAKANHAAKSADILARAQNEVDYNKLNDYVAEADKTRGDSLQGFTNKGAETRAAIELDLENTKLKLQLEGIFKKKQIEAGQVAALSLLEVEKSNYISAANDNEKVQIAKNIKSTIDENVNSGIFGLKEGDKLYSDILNEAQQALKDEDALRKKQEKDLVLAQKFAQNQREDDLIQQRINMADEAGNPISEIELISQARADMNNGTIDPKFAQAYINSLKKADTANPSKIESISKYNELVKKQKVINDKEFGWKKASFPDRAKYRADVLEAYNEGMITQKQMEALLKKQSKAFDKDPALRTAVDTVATFSNMYDSKEAKEEVKAQMHYNLMNKIIEGKEPMVALNEVIDDQIAYNFPGYNVEDLKATAQETGLSIAQVHKLLQEKNK